MKRTTYIMAGMLLAGLVVIAGCLFYMSAHGTDVRNNSLNITGEMKTVKLPDCKIVQVSLKQDKSVEGRWIAVDEGKFIVQPADSLAGNITYPDGLDKYMSVQNNGDTLNVVLNFSTDKLEEQFRNRQWFSVNTGQILLSVPSTVEGIILKVNGLTTVFKDFNRDSLAFDIYNSAIVENCRFKSLNAKADDLQLQSGEVQDLYLNLDHVLRWSVKVDSFQIDTEHLSGSREHHNQLQKGECRQVLWTPLTDGASLTMKLNQTTRLEMEK